MIDIEDHDGGGDDRSELLVMAGGGGCQDDTIGGYEGSMLTVRIVMMM